MVMGPEADVDRLKSGHGGAGEDEVMGRKMCTRSGAPGRQGQEQTVR